MSIRLTSSGLSFYTGYPGVRGEGERRFSFAHRDSGPGMAVRNIVDTTPEFSGYFSAVNVYVDTVDTIYIREDLLDQDNAVVLFSEAGIYLSPGDGIAVSPAVGDVRAAMKYDGGALTYLRDFYGSRLSFYSPLQDNLELASGLEMKSGGFIANITERNVYVTRFDGLKLLKVSEAYPYDTGADLVFYLYKLVEAAGMKNPPVYIYGPGARDNYKVLKRYFGRTSCV